MPKYIIQSIGESLMPSLFAGLFSKSVKAIFHQEVLDLKMNCTVTLEIAVVSKFPLSCRTVKVDDTFGLMD